MSFIFVQQQQQMTTANIVITDCELDLSTAQSSSPSTLQQVFSSIRFRLPSTGGTLLFLSLGCGELTATNTVSRYVVDLCTTSPSL